MGRKTKMTIKLSSKVIRYILLYFTVIISFAIIYYLLPSNSFYHQTAQFEFDLIGAEADKLLSSWTEFIKKNFADYYGGSKKDFNDWLVDINDLFCDKVDVQNYPAQIEFTCRVSASVELFTYHYTITTTLPLQEWIKVPSEQKVVLFPIFGENSFSDLEGLNPPPQAKTIIPDNYTELDIPTFAIPSSIYDEINNFGQGFHGFPSKLTGHFFRMLYLSMGIATSSTFGDIVPLTNRARILVTSESAICIVLIALFLDKLVHNIHQP